jgi:4-amino-4-deoxy-L-arabinose transferase-like glycosyltransferase
MDPGPRSLQVARSVGRWVWPTLAVSGFLAIVAYSFAHDDPAPGLSQRGLLTIALAAAVVVLLTIHRRYGPGPLARALVEYAVVAVLAGLLAAGGGADQPAADHPTPAKAGQPKPTPAATPKAEATAGDDRPAVIQAGAKVVRAVTGAVGWLADLWHQADRNTKPTDGQAMPVPPRSPAPSVLLLWRSP